MQSMMIGEIQKEGCVFLERESEGFYRVGGGKADQEERFFGA